MADGGHIEKELKKLSRQQFDRDRHKLW